MELRELKAGFENLIRENKDVKEGLTKLNRPMIEGQAVGLESQNEMKILRQENEMLRKEVNTNINI